MIDKMKALPLYPLVLLTQEQGSQFYFRLPLNEDPLSLEHFFLQSMIKIPGYLLKSHRFDSQIKCSLIVFKVTISTFDFQFKVQFILIQQDKIVSQSINNSSINFELHYGLIKH